MAKIEITKLEDVLTLNTDKLKSDEKSKVLTKVKQLIKAENKAEVLQENEAEDYPYEGVSIVGNQLVNIKFDIESKKARVVDTEIDPRDSKGRNYMAAATALKKIQALSKSQKGE